MKNFVTFPFISFLTFRVPKNIRPAVYCTAIKFGTSEDWAYLHAAYLNSNVAGEQTVILTALGCSRNATILRR